jgi:paraquat-inducible protein A
MNTEGEETLTCEYCGQEHAAVHLAPGQAARCVRCTTVMAKGRYLGPEAPLVFALTALILAVPACSLPFMSAGKLGDERTSLLFTGVVAIWDQGMRAMAALVLLLGGVVPMALIASIALLLAPRELRGVFFTDSEIAKLAAFLERWSIPEVQVLAVLVALMKLGSQVHVTIGPAFWCYCGMSVFLLMALRGIDLDTLNKGVVPTHSPGQ